MFWLDHYTLCNLSLSMCNIFLNINYGCYLMYVISIVRRFSKDMDIVDCSVPMCVTGWLFCVSQLLPTVAVIVYTTPVFLGAVIPLTIIYLSIQVGI